jgi:hypothetical protein
MLIPEGLKEAVEAFLAENEFGGEGIFKLRAIVQSELFPNDPKRLWVKLAWPGGQPVQEEDFTKADEPWIWRLHDVGARFGVVITIPYWYLEK